MIPQELPLEDRLIQLSEEASELSQASCKLIRALRGQTPVTEVEARAHLLEEIADVFVSVFALDPDMVAIETIARKKSKRWEERINEKQ